MKQGAVSIPPESLSQPRPKWIAALGRNDSIRLEACLYTLLLLACGLAFYLHWSAWEDQSAQIYMTWGLFHGMRPYVDLVDPNWPGILLPHTLAYLLSGTNAWGLRAVDLLFLLGLLIATSRILAAWNTPRSLRVLTACAYLLNYFGTGWRWTAQRESFAWPIFVIAAIPLLLELGPRGQSETPAMRPISWFVFGALAGFSLWIKPVAGLALLLMLVLTLVLCDPNRRSNLIRQCCLFILGIAFVSALFIGGMAATGTLSGFIKWGIVYDLGPYSQVKWPWPTRFWFTGQYLISSQFMPLPLLLLLSGFLMRFALRLSPGRWRQYRRPFLAALTLLLSGLMTALFQGKLHSFYHFIPMDWGIAFLAATVWSVIPWRKAFADAAIALALLTICTLFIHGPKTAGPPDGQSAADQLRPALAAQDQVVEWGYVPSLLARLQRRTPLQTFTATSLLTTSPPDSWAYRQVLERLNVALRNPTVRYLLVERQQNYQILASTPKWPIDYLSSDPAIGQTLATEYQELPSDALAKFHTFIHTTAQAAPAR